MRSSTNSTRQGCEVRVTKVRLQECTVIAEDLHLDTELLNAQKHEINIRTQAPDGEEFSGAVVEIVCTYERDEVAGQPGWRVSFLAGVEVSDEERAGPSEISIAAIEAVHPYVRQTMLSLGALMDNSWLSIPARTPGFGPDTPREVVRERNPADSSVAS